MHSNLRFFFVIVVFMLTACAPTIKPGTGNLFQEYSNNAPDKYALVYIFRDDSRNAVNLAQVPLLINSYRKSSVQMPVVIFLDKMYRAFLFEPGVVTLSIGSTTLDQFKFEAGGTYCVDSSWRDNSKLEITGIPYRDCLARLRGLELAKSLNEVRKDNNSPPLMQIGFKEMP